jgi:3-hydroxyacyl-[acyl-carrier-protein] dehydratase
MNNQDLQTGFTKKSVMWYDLCVRTSNDVQSLSADVHVPPESPWFRGHFPGNPILPGIAQLAMVFDVLRHAFDGPSRVMEVSRVRFKQMILPDDRLVVEVTARPARQGSYAFRITKSGELVCNGTMGVVAIGDPGQPATLKGDK